MKPLFDMHSEFKDAEKCIVCGHIHEKADMVETEYGWLCIDCFEKNKDRL